MNYLLTTIYFRQRIPFICNTNYEMYDFLNLVNFDWASITGGVLFFFLISLFLRFRPKKVHIPGPKSYPLVGILPHAILDFERWPERCSEYSKEFGYKTWGGGLPNTLSMGGAVYWITDPDNVKHVLSTNFDNYEKGKALRELYSDLLGTGIFASDGAIWKTHRKAMSHMFSRNLLRATGDLTLTKLKLIEDIFRCKAQKSHAAPDAIVDLQDIFLRMTFDTTTYVAFGCQMNSLESEGQHRFAQAFDEIQVLITERWFDPIFQLKRSLQIGTREKSIVALKKILTEESMKIIKERIQNARNGDHKLGPDLLSRFLDQQSKSKKGSLDDLEITDDEFQSLVMNILLAGRDTTAFTLGWTFYMLSKHPEVVKKIIEEVEQVIGSVGDASDEDFSYEKIGELRYTHAVVMEVLRIHPVVPHELKFAIKDDTLPDGTFVHAGSQISWLPLAMGRSEKLWGKDANEFRPERFLNVKEPSLFKYPVFNAGPRTCLGKPLALQTVKMTLAYMLPRFHFIDSSGHSGESKWTFTRCLKGGFPVNIAERKTN